MKHKPTLLVLSALLVLLLVSAPGVTAQGPAAPAAGPAGTAFSYQGQLKNASGAVTAACDFQFGLFDALSAGTQIGATQSSNNVSVPNGLFTVSLDFGATALDGNARFLDIAVRCPAGAGGFTPLTPRQELKPAPYSLVSLSANGLQGRPVSSSAPSANQVLSWNGAAWAPSNGPTYTAGTGLSLAGTQFSVDTNLIPQKYDHVKVVAKSGGDFSTIGAALAAITDNSASSTYLVYVAPGTYTEMITLKPYVHVQGAGQGVTTIASTLDSFVSATVVGASNAALSDLTASNTGAGGGIHYAIYNDSASPTIQNTTISATGGSGTNTGIYNDSSSAATITNTTATASGGTVSYGIVNIASALTIQNTSASASGGTDNFGIYNNTSSSATIDASRLKGATAALHLEPGDTVKVGGSLLDNGINGGGSPTCVGDYNVSYVALSAVCG